VLNLVNSGFGNWSGWSACSVMCGNGTQIRNRSCDNPAPAHGGVDCIGDSGEIQSCDTEVACPGKNSNQMMNLTAKQTAGCSNGV
jgi:hypothetical protein